MKHHKILVTTRKTTNNESVRLQSRTSAIWRQNFTTAAGFTHNVTCFNSHYFNCTNTDPHCPCRGHSHVSALPNAMHCSCTAQRQPQAALHRGSPKLHFIEAAPSCTSQRQPQAALLGASLTPFVTHYNITTLSVGRWVHHQYIYPDTQQ